MYLDALQSKINALWADFTARRLARARSRRIARRPWPSSIA
jgi:hypothetical protein